MSLKIESKGLTYDESGEKVSLKRGSSSIEVLKPFRLGAAYRGRRGRRRFSLRLPGSSSSFEGQSKRPLRRRKLFELEPVDN